MPACLSFDPEGLSASGIISHFSGRDGHIVSRLVHVSDHEYFIGGIFLNDDRQESVRTFFKVFPGESRFPMLFHIYAGFLKGIPYFLNSVTAFGDETVDSVP